MYALLMEHRDERQREELDSLLLSPVSQRARERERKIVADLTGEEVTPDR